MATARMKRKQLPFVLGIAILVVVVVAVALVANHKNSSNTSADMSGMDMSDMSKPVATDKVSISSYMFMPMVVKVKAGTAVTWTNDDSTDHTVTIDSGTGPSSSPIARGKTYTYTFAKPGTYTYHCSIHPEMHGTVTVTN